MKITRREFGHEYETYRFGYCEYADLEKHDSVADFYAQGFLPYSADPQVHNRFYRARSARLILASFSLSSENRRIAKRFDGMLTRQTLPAREAAKNTQVRSLFLDYFAKRHGMRVMSAERFDGILHSALPLSVMTYAMGDEIVAAVLEVTDRSIVHFWFSAYDPSLARQSLGMWLMLDSARRAQASHRQFLYVGTVYGNKALYKANLKPLEYWDGTAWSHDIAELKRRARAESRVS